MHREPEAASAMENSVARFSFDLLASLDTKQPAINVVDKYRSRLNELGFITPNGQVRRAPLMKLLTCDLAMYPIQKSLFPRYPMDYHYISELLSVGTNCHPFRHLLLGTWLFKSADKFLNHFVLTKEHYSVKSTNSTKDVIEQRCLILLKDGNSLEAVYRMTGKSRSYLKRLAKLFGVKLILKPKQLNNCLQQRVIKLARLGVHRRRISSICAIGVGSIEQVISAEPGLVEWRKKCHFESKRRACRVQILRYRQKHPDALRCDIKSDCNAAFFWLYLRDRPWLEAYLPKPMKPCRRNRSLTK